MGLEDTLRQLPPFTIIPITFDFTSLGNTSVM